MSDKIKDCDSCLCCFIEGSLGKCVGCGEGFANYHESSVSCSHCLRLNSYFCKECMHGSFFLPSSGRYDNVAEVCNLIKNFTNTNVHFSVAEYFDNVGSSHVDLHISDYVVRINVRFTNMQELVSMPTEELLTAVLMEGCFGKSS